MSSYGTSDKGLGVNPSENQAVHDLVYGDAAECRKWPVRHIISTKPLAYAGEVAGCQKP